LPLIGSVNRFPFDFAESPRRAKNE
jgi:hypothetical protein